MTTPNRLGIKPQTYERGTNEAPHATATESALRDWTPRDGDGIPIGPSVAAQHAARWEALLRAVYRMAEHGLQIPTARVLEVGAGVGKGLQPFSLAGFQFANLSGIDLFEDRLREARLVLPGANLVQGDGADMRNLFPDATFDVVMQQFCFCHIPDDSVKPAIAAEMLRVLKPGGFLLLHDWRMNWPRRHIRGLSRALIREWFRVGSQTRIIGRFPSQLWPPVGRPLSRFVPGIYQAGWISRALVGSFMTVLRKN